MGGTQRGVLLRGAPPGDAVRRVGQLTSERRFGLDGAVVPGLLLLVARDLALYDPPRVLNHLGPGAAALGWHIKTTFNFR